MNEFKAGDDVFYVLPRASSNGRPEPWYWRAKVRRVTGRRIVVVLEGHSRPRNTVPRHLVTQLPEGALVKP